MEVNPNHIYINQTIRDIKQTLLHRLTAESIINQAPLLCEQQLCLTLSLCTKLLWSRNTYPQCYPPPDDQGKCGSCWGFATTRMLGEKHCLHDRGKNSLHQAFGAILGLALPPQTDAFRNVLNELRRGHGLGLFSSSHSPSQRTCHALQGVHEVCGWNGTEGALLIDPKSVFVVYAVKSQVRSIGIVVMIDLYKISWSTVEGTIKGKKVQILASTRLF
eukprot:TRINITY_DN8779_c0_g2_i3.p1 TRINITY_DN8779_c0_g2~~TRINITY_DN8779_c0_g2_i3.p1  ORF type:complete len:218 (-),score=-4.60 TRINITY_DN8779_c0_g2_i3:429-1082(-)